MRFVDEFRDPKMARVLARQIARLVDPQRHYKTKRLLSQCPSLCERVGVRGPIPILAQPALLTLCLLCCLGTMPAISSAQAWQEKTSTHFRVFYQQNLAFAAAVLEYAEVYYNQIRLDLGLAHVVQRD